MDLQFTGKISKINDVRTGTGNKGEWANAEFEVTENSDKYPQIALFDFFKNGEYVDQAKNFKNNFKVGQEVTVHFNMKKNEYTKQDGTKAAFYKTSAWKIDKVSGSTPTEPPMQTISVADLNQDDHDDLPFSREL